MYYKLLISDKISDDETMQHKFDLKFKLEQNEIDNRMVFNSSVMYLTFIQQGEKPYKIVKGRPKRVRTFTMSNILVSSIYIYRK